MTYRYCVTLVDGERYLLTLAALLSRARDDAMVH